MTLPYRTLIFDWDGTLLDSIGPIVACTLSSFAPLGLVIEPERVRAAIGLGLRETFQMFFPGAEDSVLEAIRLEYSRNWWNLYRDQTHPFPAVPHLLGELEAAGYLLAVATAKSRRGLDHDLQATGLAGRFIATRTVDEAPSKPNPQMIFDLLAATATEPGAALMVGDTAHDLEMARHAGVDAVGVLSGSHAAASLEAARPLAVLAGVWELPSFLRESRCARPHDA